MNRLVYFYVTIKVRMQGDLFFLVCVVSYHIIISYLFFASKLELIRKELDDEQAPIETRILRGNNSPFMTRELQKAIMERTPLKNLYYKNKTENAKRNYKLQRNQEMLRNVKLLRGHQKNGFLTI